MSKNKNRKRKLKGPVSYYGGKYYLANKLIKYIPEHNTYVEVFGGGAQLLFAKEPYGVEVYNDIDGNIVSLFRVLQKEETFKKFYQRVYFTPYSREVYYECLEKLKMQNFENEIDKAYCVYVSLRQGINGNIGSGWSYSISIIRKNMSSTIFTWLSAIDRLPEIVERFKRVQIENKDFRDIIPRYDTEKTFFYLDPPYIKETRNRKKAYLHEMSDKDHEDLVKLILQCKGKVMLSGYPHKIYEKLEKNGWKKICFKQTLFSIYKKDLKEKSSKLDCIWINYEIQDKTLL